ncbi:DUF3696 domain-containing protein [Burkholderia diffusa]|uniref:DUF3696 domain-containing protein n=1 Tax=Burkholderia diffusa TaxID=488732 RepID=UPI00157B14A4|nr:DUF3696 domain-containing protein [Burkholderia diffusa]NTY39016.1 DUF3696 domain-containing protein [Burkholderia diffusa]
MNIISSVNLKNFRGFRNSGKIRLAPLTFLVGPNSSGKSTIADSILLTSQSMSGNLIWSTPNWIGGLVDLGSYEDTVYGHKITNSISMEFGLAVDPRGGYYRSFAYTKPVEINLQFTMKSQRGSLFGKVSSVAISDSISGAQCTIVIQATQLLIEIEGRKIPVPNSDFGLDHTIYMAGNVIRKDVKSNWRTYQKSKAGYNRLLEALISPVIPFFLSRVERVSSARSGPKRWFAKDNLVGSGEMQSGLLNDAYTMNLEPAPHVKIRSRRLFAPKEPVSKYLDELGIASTLTREDLSAYHTALKVTDNVTNVRSNLADVGFGASQAIPVIRGCVSENDSPLIIEQPEIHLHPKAQGELARLICMTSKTRQVIVETHSEHMINRARILVADGKISSTDVAIVYVDRIRSGSTVIEIGIDENGDFTREWPEGFFDERYRDSMTLLELKSREGRVVASPRKSPKK